MIPGVHSIVLLALLSTGTTPAPVALDTVPSQNPASTSAISNQVQDTTLGKRIPAIDTSVNGNDTIPKRRAAVVYSDAYGTRATIHRRLSYGMLPLFALSYFTGDKLFKDGPDASSFIVNTHRTSATAVSVLFAVNTVTGGINLWQGRHDPTDRKRKLLHSALFIASSAGFTYAGAVLANEAEKSLSKRREHRTVNLISMGLSAGSVLVMMVGHD